MAAFPPGGWDLDEYNQLVGWVSEIRQLPVTATLRAIAFQLRELDLYLAQCLTPLEFDEEATDSAEEPEASPVASSSRSFPPATQTPSVVKVKPRPTTLKTEDAPFRSNANPVSPAFVVYQRLVF